MLVTLEPQIERGMTRGGDREPPEGDLHHMYRIRSHKFWIAVSLGAAQLLVGATLLSAAADTRLADAVQKQDTATARVLLKRKIDVNAPQADGSTALLWAAHHDDVELADLLLKAGASVKAANRYGIVPLTEAAKNGNTVMIERLLKAGADVNTTLPQGDTALMFASRSGNVAAVKALLDHGATVDAREGWHGETALMWAVGENHSEVVKLLAARGADVNATAVHLTNYTKTPGTFGAGYSRYPAGGLTPLLQAVRDNSYEAAEALLAAGADPNKTDPETRTPLLVAVANAHWDMAKLLIDKGANADDGSIVEVVEVTVNDAIVHASTHHVEQLTSTDILTLMLARGAKPDTRLSVLMPKKKAFGNSVITGPADMTALYRAAKAGDLPTMQVLLAAGADAKVALKGGVTPLMTAAGEGLDTSDGEPTPPVDDRRKEAIQLLIDSGADINVADDNGVTALHFAAGNGNTNVVQFLAEKGATLDLKDKRDRTALDAANGVPGPPRVGGFVMAPRIPVAHGSTVALLKQLMNLPADLQAKPGEKFVLGAGN